MDEVIKNRKVNYKRKPLPENIQECESSLIVFKEAIARAQAIVGNLKGNPGWEALKTTYDEKIQGIDENLAASFKEMPDKLVNYWLAVRTESVKFRDTVEDMESRIEDLTDEANQVQARLNDLKQRSRTTEANKF